MPAQIASRARRLDSYQVVPDSPLVQRDFLYVIASLAERSAEPWARDVVRVAKTNAILPLEVQGFQEYPGRGLGGLVQLPEEHRPRAVLAGNRSFMAESGLEIPAMLEVTARQWEADSDSEVVLLGWDAWVRAVVRFIR